MKNECDLKFSKDALLSRAMLLVSKTELDIFVEDLNKEYEYEEIFERLLSTDLKINCILPMGGKSILTEAFKLFGENEEYGKCFFIADGDFDVVLNKEMIVADNFVYLKKYNIESYLLHKDTILNYMRPKLKKTKKETKEIVKYDDWLNTITPFFKKLFSLHCLVQKISPEVKNVSREVEQFLDKNGFPKEDNYEKYKNEISPLVSDIDFEIDCMFSLLESVYGNDPSDFVCGKCFISSLKSMLNSKIKKKINYDELKAELIRGFDITALYYVRDKLYDYIKL